MRQPKITVALAGTLLLALALGCQAPTLTSTPKVAVSYGSLQWSSDADLAVLLDLRPLLQARKLQAASATVVGPITTVVAKVTGPNIVGEILSPEVHTWECPGGLATLNFSHLPDGEVTVVVNAFDANHNLVKSTLPVKAQILQGHVAEVTVQCVDADGQLIVHFDCTELCGGSPTPAPSSTPTPVPTPTPRPTPTATPTPAPTPTPRPTPTPPLHIVAGQVADRLSDKMSAAAYGPNGTPDLHFTVSFTLYQPTLLKLIGTKDVHRSVNGNWLTSPQKWSTFKVAKGDEKRLGVFLNGAPLLGITSITDSMGVLPAGSYTLDLYGDDPGLSKSGDVIDIIVQFDPTKYQPMEAFSYVP